MEEVGVEDQPQLEDPPLRTVLVPQGEDHMEDVDGDVGDVHIGEHDEEVAEPAAVGVHGEDVDGGEVSEEADGPNEQRGPADHRPEKSCNISN